MSIAFPKDFATKKITGQVELYCPSDEDKDVIKYFAVQDSPVIITIPKVNTGLHELHLSWKDGEVSYYLEKKIFL